MLTPPVFILLTSPATLLTFWLIAAMLADNNSRLELKLFISLDIVLFVMSIASIRAVILSMSAEAMVSYFSIRALVLKA